MIDHISLYVSQYAKSKAFYEAALAPLGYVLEQEFEGKVGGFSEEGKEGADVWIIEADEQRPQHIAFRAKSKEAVNAFHAAGLAAGGRENGMPGPRPEYGEGYYAAFILDLDGHNIEAVCRTL